MPLSGAGPSPRRPTPAATIKNPDPDRGALVKGPEVQDAYTSRGVGSRRAAARPASTTAPSSPTSRPCPSSGEAANRLCVEAPMMGVAIGPSDKTPGDAARRSTATTASPPRRQPVPDDDACTPRARPLRRAARRPDQDLVPGDYIVAVDIPKNPVGRQADVPGDHGGGRQRLRRRQLPAAGELPADTAEAAADGRPAPATTRCRRPSRRRSRPASSPPAPAHCTRCDVTDPAFLDGGGSPFEGQDRPLVRRQARHRPRAARPTAPNFNLFTAVPIPTHFWGLTINDLGLTLDKRSVNYGEAQGLPLRARRPLRLGGPARRHRPTPTSTASTRPSSRRRHLQLPGAGRSVPEHVPLRRQRPRPAG